MKFLSVLFLMVCASLHANQLILVGGGDYPTQAMKRFVEWAGGKQANILIVSWATDDPNASYVRLNAALAPFSPHKVVAAPHRDHFFENKDLFLNQLKEATGVFFTGGDQVFIMKTAKLFPEVLPAIRDKFKDGTVFGGSSAGTAVMPRIMYTGEGDFTVINPAKVEMVAGFDLLPGILLDQHFIIRQRQNRLISVLLRNEEKIGIGINEDNAISIEDGKNLEVLGNGQVLIFERKGRQSFNMTLLFGGQHYRLGHKKNVQGR